MRIKHELEVADVFIEEVMVDDAEDIGGVASGDGLAPVSATRRRKTKDLFDKEGATSMDVMTRKEYCW